MQKNQLVVVFGGSGFLGSVVVQHLLERGYRVRVAVRHPERAVDLMVSGNVGQVAFVKADIKRNAEVQAAVEGAYAVVNCVGILYSFGKQNFTAIHVKSAERVAAATKKAGARCLVHVSAIGAAADSHARYGRSKAAGEKAVREAFASAVILRPSVIFGRGDGFFNLFAGFASGPVGCVPLIGGHTRMQPVYVGDVAEACVEAIRNPDCKGKIYELGGDIVAEFRQFLDLIGDYTNRKMRYLRLPFWLAKIIGAVLGLSPKPPLTRDQVLSLQKDNVVAKEALGLADLGISATSIHAILPTYMHVYRKGGQYSQYGEE